MATTERSLLGHWIADLPPEHEKTLEPTELIFHDDGRLEYLIWNGPVPQRISLNYKARDGRLFLMHTSTTSSIPFEITAGDQLALQLLKYPCIYRRRSQAAAEMTQKFSLSYRYLKGKLQDWWSRQTRTTT